MAGWRSIANSIDARPEGRRLGARANLSTNAGAGECVAVAVLDLDWPAPHHLQHGPASLPADLAGVKTLGLTIPPSMLTRADQVA
jgi:hypothetical protein